MFKSKERINLELKIVFLPQRLENHQYLKNHEKRKISMLKIMRLIHSDSNEDKVPRSKARRQ